MTAPLLASTLPIETWLDGADILLVQINAEGERQEIRISRDRVDGVIRLLQDTRDDA